MRRTCTTDIIALGDPTSNGSTTAMECPKMVAGTGSSCTMLRIMHTTTEKTDAKVVKRPQPQNTYTKRPVPLCKKQPPLKKPVPHNTNRGWLPHSRNQPPLTKNITKTHNRRSAARHPSQETLAEIKTMFNHSRATANRKTPEKMAATETTLIALKQTTALILVGQSQHLSILSLQTQKNSILEALMIQTPGKQAVPAVPAATL